MSSKRAPTSHQVLAASDEPVDEGVQRVVLNAIQSEQLITIDDTPMPALMLTGPQSRWVAAVRHAGLTILIAAHDLAPASLCLQPISDPTERLLGPEPPDA
jgi:hypothetical protein